MCWQGDADHGAISDREPREHLPSMDNELMDSTMSRRRRTSGDPKRLNPSCSNFRKTWSLYANTH